MEVKILIGHPLAGKTTWSKKQDQVVVSFDKIANKISNLDFNKYHDYKNIFLSKIKLLTLSKKPFIVDYLNTNKLIRKDIIDIIPKDYKITAIVFPKLTLEECINRNIKRNKETGRELLSINQIKSSLENDYSPSYSEGFNEIIYL